MVKRIISLFMLALLGSSAVLYWQFHQALQRPLAVNKAQIIDVQTGTSGHGLLAQLQGAGWIKQDWPYRLLMRLDPSLAKVRAGCYTVSRTLTVPQLLANIADGREQHFSVTLIEGETYPQWRQRLSEAPYLGQAPEASVAAKALGVGHIEGMLMADTYQYRCHDNAMTVMQRSRQAMVHYLDSQWQSRQANLPLKTPYQALILASIIEKETAQPQERPEIAAVFINRMRQHMRLQTDPTVIYGLGEHFDGNLTKADLKQPTAFNTYVIKGLPPTPIAMPSRAAIAAALHPADVPYLYFVAKGDGSHVFSQTLHQHNLAVDRYQRGKK